MGLYILSLVKQGVCGAVKRIDLIHTSDYGINLPDSNAARQVGKKRVNLGGWWWWWGVGWGWLVGGGGNSTPGVIYSVEKAVRRIKQKYLGLTLFVYGMLDFYSVSWSENEWHIRFIFNNSASGLYSMWNGLNAGCNFESTV